MKNVLITGGAGFIGTNVTRRLLELGYKVTILDCFLEQIHGDKQELPDDLEGKVRLIRGSVEDKDIFYKALENQHIVIHYAAETGTGQSMYSIARYSNVNIQATALLCDFIMNEENGIENVIVASSRSIYGEGKYVSEVHGEVYPNARTYKDVEDTFDVRCPISGKPDLTLVATDENSKIHPSSYYGITKQVQEEMIILTARLKGINGFALRYQNVYGPGQSLKNPYTGVLSVFSRLALKDEKILIFEDGLESRDFVYIQDVVNATVSCVEKRIEGQHILNVGCGISTTILEVAKYIVAYLNSKSEIEISGAFREGDIRHNFADMSLIKEVLDFAPQWTFKDGLSKFLDWVLTQNDIPKSNDDFVKSISELEERGLLKISIMSPLVSIVFTSYNHKEYLRQALESLLNQTYTNFELIIVDDCSIDGSQSILKEYESDIRIKLILSKVNSGSYVKSSNFGASFAKGEYILFAQCDDYSEPTQLEELVKGAELNPDCGVVYSMSKLIDSNGEKINDDYQIRESLFKSKVKTSQVIEGSLMSRFFSYSCVIPNLSAALIRKDLYEAVGGLSDDFLVVADWDFWLKLTEKTNFYFIKKPLNNFRQHGATIRNSIKIATQVEEVFKMFYKHISDFGISGSRQNDFKIGAGAVWFAYGNENKMLWLKSLPEVIKRINRIEPRWFKFLMAGASRQLHEYKVRRTQRKL